jgi:hypothetical protein
VSVLESFVGLVLAAIFAILVYVGLFKLVKGGVRMARITGAPSDWMIAAGLGAIILIPLAYEVLLSPVENLRNLVFLTSRAALWSGLVVLGGIAIMYGWDLLKTAQRRY